MCAETLYTFNINMHPPLISTFPNILHGGDYNPDQWWGRHPEIIEEDFQLMPQASCNCFSLGIFAWSRLEPVQDEFQPDWLDDIMDRCAAAGSKVFLATPTGGKPNWLAQAYPEVCRVDANGRRQPQQERHNHCPSSPVMRERAGIIIRKLAERYANHPALAGWHISNEIAGECHCDLCLSHFRKWLRKKYGSLEELNERWWTYFWSRTYIDWDQIHPEDPSFDGLRLDWKRFSTYQLLEFLKHEISVVRQWSELPVTTNFMGFFPDLDYHEFARHIDFISNDSYPELHCNDGHIPNAMHSDMAADLLRALKNKPWLLMESTPDATNWQTHHRIKRPGIHRSEMLQALAHGSDGTLYFQWRKGRGGAKNITVQS